MKQDYINYLLKIVNLFRKSILRKMIIFGGGIGLKNVVKKARKIKMIISDVDGVLTDGKIIIGNNGQEFKAFNSQDGMGINMAQKQGLRFAIITGRISKIVEIRAEELNIKDVYQDVDNKRAILKMIMDKYNLKKEELAYIGDDLNDLPVLNRVGLAVTVNNGVKKVRETADYVTTRNGGQGAVRETIDFILACRD